MAGDPYKAGLITRSPYRARRPLRGRIVAVMDMRLENRGLELLQVPSRVLCSGDIHELILTTESAEPGGRVDRIAYLGFVEVDRGGVLLRGDELRTRGAPVGRVLGFDVTHMPNHLNIVVQTGALTTGHERGIALEDPVEFVPSPPQP